MDDTVSMTVQSGVAEVAIRRPEVLNALDLPTGRLWSEAVREAVSRTDVTAILLLGGDRAFCAGGDVEAMAQEGPEYVHELASVVSRGIEAMVSSSTPVVAAVTGVVAGGGLGLLLSSDYAVASENARIGALYAGIGMTPDLSVSAQLSDAVGQRRALELLLTDRMLDAKTAQDWGLVAEVLEPSQVVARAREVAQGWASTAPWAYGQAKRLVRARPHTAFSSQLADEAQTIATAAAGEEASTLIEAFLERRRT